MRRGYVAFLVLTLTGLGLAGCGLFVFEQREAWRTQAEEACMARREVHTSLHVRRAPEINGPGVCGMVYPFRISALANGSVSLNTQATLACPMTSRAERWIEEVVQPAAQYYYAAPVAELKAGSYACRSRNNQRGARLSEHSFGNALDVMAFVLADGREVTVARGWHGSPQEQDFLREVFVGSCEYFTTVLGPGSDMFHYDHFHLDLARHDPRGERRVCRPVIKFTPRLGPGAPAAGAVATYTPAPARSAQATPLPAAPVAPPVSASLQALPASPLPASPAMRPPLPLMQAPMAGGLY